LDLVKSRSTRVAPPEDGKRAAAFVVGVGGAYHMS
jgi:hypothetical protein